MYFSITTNDKEGLNPTAVLVLTDQYGKTSLSISIPESDIIIEKSQVFGESQLLGIFRESIREADEKHHAHGLKIFITEKALGLHSDTIANLIVSLVNKNRGFIDYSLEILLKPYKHFLREIILVTEDKQLRDAVLKKLSLKSDWSKARKLDFVLDCLDLEFDRKSICKRHFIHQSSFPKYLQDFSEECKPELLERLQNIQADQYGNEVASIFNDCEQFLAFVAALKSAHQNGFFLDSFSIDFQLSNVLRILDNLSMVIDYQGQLFPYIAHLVPHPEYLSTHPQRKPSSKGRRSKGKGKKKNVRIASSELEEEISDDYAYLLKRIKKIQLLKNSVFPVSKLQDFWAIDDWDQFTSGDAPAHKITRKLLSSHYDLGTDRLHQILSKSPKYN